MTNYERIDSNEKFDGKTRESHELRYLLASYFVKPDDLVIDYGCGTGYGKKFFNHYVGYDKDQTHSDYVDEENEKIHMFQKFDFEKDKPEDIQAWHMGQSLGEVSILFEIIEHLNRIGVDNITKMAKRAVKYIILSTPVVKNSNPYHKQNFSRQDILNMFCDKNWELAHYLEQDKTYGIFIFKRKTQ